MIEKILLKSKLIFLPCEENLWRPKVLDGQVLFHFLFFLLILKLIALGFLFQFPKTSFFAEVSKAILIDLVNEKRTSFGIAPLRENAKLDQAAYLKAKDIFEKEYFAHYSPQGVSPWYWIKKEGYTYNVAGENLAIGFLDSKEVLQAWLESSLHKQNLLNSKYEEMGMAVLTDKFQDQEATVVVHLFASPLKQKEKKIEPKKTTETKNPVSSEQIVPTSTESVPVESTSTEPASTEPISTESTSTEQITSTTELVKTSSLAVLSLSNINPPENLKKKTFLFKIIYFLNVHYFQCLEIFIYASLFIIILLLLINIFVKFDIQHKDLILKTLGVITILIFFIYLDKEKILYLIPHNLQIF